MGADADVEQFSRPSQHDYNSFGEGKTDKTSFTGTAYTAAEVQHPEIQTCLGLSAVQDGQRSSLGASSSADATR